MQDYATKYSGQIDTSDPVGYPEGKAQNVSSQGAGDGTPLERDWLNDFMGFAQALLKRNDGANPSGTPEKVGASQLLDSLTAWLGGVTGDFQIERMSLSAIAYLNDYFDTSNETSAALTGIAWNPDGTRFYVANVATIYEYDAASPWVLAGATPTASNYTVTEDTAIRSVRFNADATKMFVMGSTNKIIYRYSLSPAGDVSAASYDTNFLDVSTEVTGPVGGYSISKSGERIYVCARTGTTVFQYDLTTGFDLSSGAYASRVATTNSNLETCAVRQDGRVLWTLGPLGELEHFKIDTAYELNSETREASKDIMTGTPGDMVLSADERFVYITNDSVPEKVMRFNASTLVLPLG